MPELDGLTVLSDCCQAEESIWPNVTELWVCVYLFLEARKSASIFQRRVYDMHGIFENPSQDAGLLFLGLASGEKISQIAYKVT